jgi:hypothetical protein
LVSTVSGQGPVAGCCECGDEPSGSCATELVNLVSYPVQMTACKPPNKKQLHFEDKPAIITVQTPYLVQHKRITNPFLTETNPLKEVII